MMKEWVMGLYELKETESFLKKWVKGQKITAILMTGPLRPGMGLFWYLFLFVLGKKKQPKERARDDFPFTFHFFFFFLEISFSLLSKFWNLYQNFLLTYSSSFVLFIVLPLPPLVSFLHFWPNYYLSKTN